MYLWMEKSKARAATVFSPPDNSSISRKRLVGGIVEYLMPCKNGSSTFSKFKYAVPPSGCVLLFVSCLQILSILPDIWLKASIKHESLQRNSSINTGFGITVYMFSYKYIYRFLSIKYQLTFSLARFKSLYHLFEHLSHSKMVVCPVWVTLQFVSIILVLFIKLHILYDTTFLQGKKNKFINWQEGIFAYRTTKMGQFDFLSTQMYKTLAR